MKPLGVGLALPTPLVGDALAGTLVALAATISLIKDLKMAPTSMDCWAETLEVERRRHNRITDLKNVNMVECET